MRLQYAHIYCYTLFFTYCINSLFLSFILIDSLLQRAELANALFLLWFVLNDPCHITAKKYIDFGA